jgi:NADPH2:quinone reductase
MVVQIAKRLGARVIATAGNADRRERVLSYGADVVIDRSAIAADLRGEAAVDAGVPDSVLDAVLDAAPGGVDVYWESLREPDFDAAVRLLADGGRMVLMAGRDARPPFPVGPFYVKGCRLLGFVMFKASWQAQAAAAEDLNRWMAAGVAAPIGAVMPLSATADAHRLQEGITIGRTGAVSGKIVVEP